MSCVQLNQHMRDVILEKMLDHAFGERQRELDEAKMALAGDIYDDVYSDDMKRLMWKMPAGFLPTATGFQVIFAGQYTTVSWREERRAAEEHFHKAVRTYPATDDLSKRHFELEKQDARLREDRARAKGAARAALNSCATTRQLVEIWPEAAPFVTSVAIPAQQRALTLSIGDLNRQLNLSPAATKKFPKDVE